MITTSTGLTCNLVANGLAAPACRAHPPWPCPPWGGVLSGIDAEIAEAKRKKKRKKKKKKCAGVRSQNLRRKVRVASPTTASRW